MLSQIPRTASVGSHLAFLIFVAGLAGCSAATGTVSGKVTYQGKELKGGNVTFVSTEKGPSFSARIEEDGTYKAQNVQAGKYKLCVETASLKPPQNVAPAGPARKAPSFEPGVGVVVPEGYKPSNPGESIVLSNLKRYVPIPDSYATPETSDLAITVTGGNQTENIELK